MRRTSIRNFPQAAQQARQRLNELADEFRRVECRAYRPLRCIPLALRGWFSQLRPADQQHV